MSSFLQIHNQEFKDEDDEDEDFKICDFAERHVQRELNSQNSNIALHTRSKVTLPDNGTNKRNKYEEEEEYTHFLHTMFQTNPMRDEQNDEDFDIGEEERLNDYDEYTNTKISKQILREIRDLSDHSNSPTNNGQKTKKVTAHLRIPFHALQRQQIRTQLKQLFQILVIIRHLSLNSEKHSDAHTLSTQLLYQFNYSRHGAIQSIRYAMAKQSGILEQYNAKNMTQTQANTIAFYHTQHLFIDSMMNIEYCDDYFEFNQHIARSYAANLNRFCGTLLNNRYIPIYDSVPDQRPKHAKFTEIEEKLLGLGVKEYGQKLAQPMISNKNIGINKNIIINDWTAMRDRFLPHKDVQLLQTEIAKIRTLNHELRYDYRIRPPSKQMNDLELSLLAQGTQKYGEHSWTKISKELLPNWTARELKSRYLKKLKPLIEKMKINVESNLNKVRFFNPSMDASDRNNFALNQNYNSVNTNNNNRNSCDNFDSEMLELQSLFCDTND